MTTRNPPPLTFEVADSADLPPLEHFGNWSICQMPEWLGFVEETQRATSVHAAITTRDGEIVGRFVCLLVNRLGIRIAGAPMRGWTTHYMDANLRSDIPRQAIVRPLLDFTKGELRAHHVEFMDRRLSVEDAQELGVTFDTFRGYEIDLTRSEDELLTAMSSACRRCIRKAEKLGVTIEEASDESFADDYWVQLKDVFAKQGLTPPYGVDRVRALIAHLRPTGRLLTLRARDAQGRPIATGIFPASEEMMYFWGGASHREFQANRPNEALQWHAMRYWRDRGVTLYDMGGSGAYKAKYGGREIATPWIRSSRITGLEALRTVAKKAFAARQRLRARVG